MGHTNSVQYVQWRIDLLLKDCRSFARAYIDDVVVFSKILEEHKAHLHTVLSIFKRARICMNPTKSYIGFPSVRLLGQVVSAFGMTTAPEKTEAIAAWTFPKNLAKLESWLGATGWLRFYIPRYATIVKPLQDRKTLLARPGPVKGGPRKRFSARTDLKTPTSAELHAFKTIQDYLGTGAYLSHFDPTRTLFGDVDSSHERGHGVMWFHVKPEWKAFHTKDFKTPPPSTLVEPIMFLSRLLTSAEEKYWPTELEVACLVWAVRKVRHMVEGSPHTVIYTDHSASVALVKQTSLHTTSTKVTNLKLTLASQYLQQYNLSVYYKPGRIHLVPDALSRLHSNAISDKEESLDSLYVEPPTSAVLDNKASITPSCYWTSTIVVLADAFRQRLKQGYEEDAHLREIEKTLLENDNLEEPDRATLPFKRDDKGLLWHVSTVESLCIPRSLYKEVFTLAHTPAHLGLERTLDRLEGLYIKSRTRAVRQFIQHCPQCLRIRTRRHTPYGSMQPILVKPLPHHTITIDFILALPGDTNVCLTVTCKFTKRLTFIPGKDTWTAEDWARALRTRLALADWGWPAQIISDRDRKFVAELWRHIFESLDVKLLYSTAWHPQTDGQSERTNQTAEIALRYLIPLLHDPTQWPTVLPLLQIILNTAPSASTGYSAYELLFGEAAPHVTGLFQSILSDNLNVRFAARVDAKQALDAAAMSMKKYYDRRHKSQFFRAGDKVLLRLHKGYDTIYSALHPKFSDRYARPFLVKKRVGKLAYELELPPIWKMHPVVSIAHLETYPKENDPYHRLHPEPGPVADSPEGDDYEVEQLVGRRERRVGRSRRLFVEYLVRWQGYGPEHDSWYREEDLPNARDLVDDYNSLHEP